MNEILKRLNKKNVFLTRGAGHLGKHFAKAIAENGGNVFITDICKKEIERTVHYVNSHYPDTCNGAVMDISSEESIKSLINNCNAKKLAFDCLINNAYPFNKNFGSNVDELSVKDLNEHISMHIGGYFNVTKFFLKHLCLSKNISVINIASIYGVVPPDFSIYKEESFTMPLEYGISKSSIVYMTKYFSNYYKEKKYRFNCISPGGIYRKHSNSFQESYKLKCNSKGLLNEKDVVGAMVFLLSDESKYIKGQNIIVDDGFTI